MVRLLLASVLLTSLTALVGCGASAKSSTMVTSAPIERTRVATTEPPPPPPGSMDMSFSFGGEPSAPTTERARGEVKAISCRPNVQEKPTHGAVHAAY